jgi:hypothetical protein
VSNDFLALRSLGRKGFDSVTLYTIITDFEYAVLRTVTAVFSRHINHQGCFYHQTQASWRKIQQHGLVPLYNNDGLFCGMMDGLAFLPVPDLTNGMLRSVHN